MIRECCICRKTHEWRLAPVPGMSMRSMKKFDADIVETPAGLVCHECLVGTLSEIIERISECDPVLAKEVIAYTIRRKRVLMWRKQARQSRIEARMQDQASELRRMASDDEYLRDIREARLEAQEERRNWAGQG